MKQPLISQSIPLLSCACYPPVEFSSPYPPSVLLLSNTKLDGFSIGQMGMGMSLHTGGFNVTHGDEKIGTQAGNPRSTSPY